MSYCTQCGKPLAEGVQFCTQCGAQASAATPSQTPASPAAPPQFAPVAVANAPAAAAATSGSGCRNLAIGAAVVLLIVAALGAVGAFYAYRSVKQKATAVLHSAGVISGAVGHHNDTTPGAPPPQSGPADVSASPSSFAPWKPSSATTSSGAGSAPLKEGMLVVTAIADMSGDYESFKQITRIDADGVTLSYHSEHPPSGGGGDAPSSTPREANARRTVLTSDLASAHDYAELFGDNDPPSFPGTTAISASHDVLAELKGKGTTQFSFRPDGLKGAISSLVNTLGGIAGIDPKTIGDGSLAKASKEECALQRVGDGSVAFPVLLNGEATKLPAVHAHCATDDGPADFYILDQPDYPLMLSWKLGQGSRLQVIKITYPAEKKPSAPKMEQDLEEKKKVEIYGIYFDFASDRLKPESTPVLDEIAQVMEKHPDWKLSVSGHTDNIGGDAYNLDLSKRRAAAVKQALVTRYHIAPDRLTTDGYGASRPVDTNDTLEGRARNRRVELMRE
jgi:outer membrane protein OmpA-like peptidoglycan-associated protein